jgi:glycogen debranching enzyme
MTLGPWTFGDESAAIAAGTVTVVNGTTFAICAPSGDMTTQAVQGLFVGDTRICSRFELTVNGGPIEALAVNTEGPSAAAFIGRTQDRSCIVHRSLRIGHGAVAAVEIKNRGTDARALDVHLRVASDFGSVFAVKEGRRTRDESVEHRVEGGRAIRLGDEGSPRGAVVRVVGGADELLPPDGADGGFRWRVDLDPRSVWRCRIAIAAIREGEELEVTTELATGSGPKRRPPRVHSDIEGLALAFQRGLKDLDSLRLVDPAFPDDVLVAAGAPWFMTLFGRDSLLTSWMALPFDPSIGLATARTLARLQGKRTDPATEEQPGRILHEIRFGTGPSLSLADADRYYGSVDATPLFVMLVDELWRWGLPWDEVRPLLPAVDAALEWLASDGDPDADGFVEHERLSPAGLVNQGWKDSWDAISFADGRLAEPPIALAEVQGYAYAAWRSGAQLAAAAGDYVLAAARAKRAARLRYAFDDAFWLPERGYYALALDGSKRPADALASNLGHLLWCGIVPEQRVHRVAAALVSADLFSSWGVRTLGRSCGRYDPLGYHTGSVWPHDTAIAVMGLRRAGCDAEAATIACGLLTAARANGGRLPELFAGIGPADFPAPVPYPASCSPQAWASAAPLLVVRALLGLEVDVPNARITLQPSLPAGRQRLSVDGIRIAGSDASIDVEGDAVAIRNLPAGVSVIRRG